MSATYTHTLQIDVGIGAATMRFDAEVEYGCTPGTPAHFSLWDGGDPGDPAELEVQKVTLLIPDIMAFVPTGEARPTKEVEAPEWLFDFIANDDAVYQVLGDACDWGEDRGDPDYALEHQREDQPRKPT